MVQTKYYMCDFETTSYEGQESTEVWATACVELGTEDVQVWNNISRLFHFYAIQRCNCVMYFHNLKFDGEFILYHLIYKMGFKPATTQPEDILDTRFLDRKQMHDKEFVTSISERGQWYSILVKWKGHYLEFRDSLKLLPFSVEAIGKSFKTKHRKGRIRYTGERHAYGEITAKEREYIANDVLVVKEALEQMFADGNNRLTIGSCCMAEFKQSLKTGLNNPLPMMKYGEIFPNLYEFGIDPQLYGESNAGEYVRNGYGGGWCYLVPEKAGKRYKSRRKGGHKGLTADVNSLYPSVMGSGSGNKYPFGLPKFWKVVPACFGSANTFSYIRVRTRFKIKEGKLPFIHIRHSYLYPQNESLTTSDVWDYEDGCYKRYYPGEDGKVHDTFVELTMTEADWALFQDHYDLIGCEVLDGCTFQAVIGLFDDYINKWAEIKKNSSGAVRSEAKLFLNNLYGRLAMYIDSSFKLPYTKGGVVGYYNIPAKDKQPGYIAGGAAVTSYARCFTIRHAQENYHGPSRRGFIYADTDSIHCDLRPEELKGLDIHPSNFNAWKLEAYWDEALFVRQKTYIEHVTHEGGEPSEPWYNVKCAGLPKHCKNLFLACVLSRKGDKPGKVLSRLASLEGCSVEELDLSAQEEGFLYGETVNKREITDFKVGIEIPGKLRPRRLPGGIVLEKCLYKMR